MAPVDPEVPETLVGSGGTSVLKVVPYWDLYGFMMVSSGFVSFCCFFFAPMIWSVFGWISN